MQKLIAKALADPESDSKPISVTAATLDALGIDVPTLLVAVGRLNLAVLPRFGAGIVLVARSPEILQEAKRLRDELKPVPFIPVRAPKVAKAAQENPPASTRGTPVKPLAPAVEQARRDRARQNLRAARAARAHPNYDGQLD